MKRLVAILFVQILLVKVLLPSTDTFELAKLPALIEHFLEHQQQSPELTFWAFLGLHYENPQHHSEDHKAHNNLPFGSHQHENCPLQVWYTNPEFVLQFCQMSLDADWLNTYVCPEDNMFLSSIWQPPKMV